MIVKSFELKKYDLKNNKYFLFYGNNKGLIEEVLETNIKSISKENIFNYEENEIIKNLENFEENISNKSFFEEQKIIIINRTTDKIAKIIESIIKKDSDDVCIVLISGVLEKKSKLRALFEKNQKTICVPFDEDNQKSLNFIAQNFLKDRKIILSQQNINLIIERSRGDRLNLHNELSKIENFAKNKKKIETEDIIKLTNLSENISYNELIDNALAKNQKKTLYIINENNFVSEDSILIIKILINKLKRLLKIKSQVKQKKNLENVIASYKPPIFWKEKEIVIKQINCWDNEKIKNLLFETTNIEKLVKKNPGQSSNMVTNFLLEQTNN